MNNNLTVMIFDDTFYLDPCASCNLQQLRFRVSKFEFMVMSTHHFLYYYVALTLF